MVHGLGVAARVVVLVEVQRAVQLFQVDHVGQLRRGEAHDAERTARRGVTAHVEGGDLDGDVGSPSHLDEVLDLLAHHLRVAVGPVQDRLVDHRPQPRGGDLRVGSIGQTTLPMHAHPHATVHVVVGGGRAGEADDGASVSLGLQQSGDELHLEGADHRRGLLQADVDPEPVGKHVTVLVPPSLGVGAGDQTKESLALLTVVHSVEFQQVVDIATFETDLTELHSADLGVGRADGVSGVVPGNVLLLAQPSELGAQQNAQHCGPTTGIGQEILCGLVVLDGIGYHFASLGVVLARATAQYTDAVLASTGLDVESGWDQRPVLRINGDEGEFFVRPPTNWAEASYRVAER